MPPTAVVAAATLVLGFAVADVTGVRPLGGIVLFLGALWCGLRWRAARGLPVALGLVAVFLVAFGLSHAVADVLGSWGSVLTLSAIVGLVTWWVADRRPA
ncbi:MAG: hypothetical protein M0P31_00805 [Solirubrobacteraceae bacterium]|nr:hypothetical protein [Solirubrobacteraceae bacterium]